MKVALSNGVSFMKLPGKRLKSEGVSYGFVDLHGSGPCRYALHLNEGAFGESLDGHGAAGGERSAEELGVDIIHGGEVPHVGQWPHRECLSVCQAGYSLLSGLLK